MVRQKVIQGGGIISIAHKCIVYSERILEIM
jgi:hypothetical protein